MLIETNETKRNDKKNIHLSRTKRWNGDKNTQTEHTDI